MSKIEIKYKNVKCFGSYTISIIIFTFIEILS
jgi:hypothetical protein